MTVKDFDGWLSRYKSAWETRDPQVAAKLFTEDARYYETPFSAPFSGRENIYRYWSDVPLKQENIDFTYHILAVIGASGIAHWQARFNRLPSCEPVALDGVLQATFVDPGLCRIFRGWWHCLEGSEARKIIEQSEH
jgi:hypothetical protein